eukprot:gene16622-biopygen9803
MVAPRPAHGRVGRQTRMRRPVRRVSTHRFCKPLVSFSWVAGGRRPAPTQGMIKVSHSADPHCPVSFKSASLWQRLRGSIFPFALHFHPWRRPAAPRCGCSAAAGPPPGGGTLIVRHAFPAAQFRGTVHLKSCGGRMCGAADCAATLRQRPPAAAICAAGLRHVAVFQAPQNSAARISSASKLPHKSAARFPSNAPPGAAAAGRSGGPRRASSTARACGRTPPPPPGAWWRRLGPLSAPPPRVNCGVALQPCVVFAGGGQSPLSAGWTSPSTS